MNPLIRITRSLYSNALADLTRPHPFALERVGFMYGRCALDDAGLVLMGSYQSVPDDDYIDDPRVGARINSTAIRRAMQVAFSDSRAVLHVHVHDHEGRPDFSLTDLDELARLVPPFCHAAPGSLHGALVLSRNSGSALVWARAEAQPVPTECVSIVGYPLCAWRRS